MDELKDPAFKNKKFIFTTFDVVQVEIFELNFSASLNIPSIFITLDVFHFETSELKSDAR